MSSVLKESMSTLAKDLRNNVSPSLCHCKDDDLSEAQINYYEKADNEWKSYEDKFQANFGNSPYVSVEKKEFSSFVEFFSNPITPIPRSVIPAPTNIQSSSDKVLQPSGQFLVVNSGLSLGSTPLLFTSLPNNVQTSRSDTSNKFTSSNSCAVSSVSNMPTKIVYRSPITSIAPLLSNNVTVQMNQGVLGNQVAMKTSVINPTKPSAPQKRLAEDVTVSLAKKLKPLETINVIVDGKLCPITGNEASTSLGGRTYPSLVVYAKASLRPSSDPNYDDKHEKKALELNIKKVLSFTPDKFCDWLRNIGLLRLNHFCSIHKTDDGKPMPLNLGMYTENNHKSPTSGGLVWVSDCCPQHYVSVFSGSFFENSPYPPNDFIKLIYHWASHTSILNILKWLQVTHVFVKNVFTNLRAVCTAAIHEHFEKLGGEGKKIQVAVVCLGYSRSDSSEVKTKVDILAALDPVNMHLRLRTLEPLPDDKRTGYFFNFSKNLDILLSWIDLKSTILIDDSLDINCLNNLGFKIVVNSPSKNAAGINVYPNHVLINYIRTVIPNMFFNTLSLLPILVIQQFLDELVWRERFGYTSLKAFDTIIKHLIEQTKLDTGASLLKRLSKISANPYRDWSYAKWKSNCNWKFDSAAKKSKSSRSLPKIPESPAAQASPAQIPILKQLIMSEDGTPAIVNIGNLQNSVKNVINFIPDEQQASSSNSSWNGLSAAPFAHEELEAMNVGSILLEPFFYGTISGNQDKQNIQVDLHVTCMICRRLFVSNIALTEHLISHALNNSLNSTELKELCKYCCKVFSTQHYLEHQKKMHLTDMKDYSPKSNPICLICNTKFKSPGSLASHMIRNHYELELPYNCSVCSFRTSIFIQMVQHIKEVHNTDDTMFCPFCFDVKHILLNGKPSSKTQIGFIYHIQKHQYSYNKKCLKCCINCHNKTILKQHEQNEHKSYNKEPDVERFQGETEMPAPLHDPFTPKMDRYQKYAFGPYKILSSINSDLSKDTLGTYCIECETKITEPHFVNELLCMKCEFSTNCERSIVEHYMIFHLDHTGTVPPLYHIPTNFERNLYCSCSFSTTNGNSMAKHLVLCGKTRTYLEPKDCNKNTSLASVIVVD